MAASTLGGGQTDTAPSGNEQQSPQILGNDDARAIVCPGRMYKTLVFLVLCLAVLGVGMDSLFVAAPAITIADEFASIGDLGWYMSAYLLTASVSQLRTTRLYAQFDIKYAFFVSHTAFLVGSILSAIASMSLTLVG